jgi:hypothetical protein
VSRTEPINALRDIFKRYLASKAELAADVERLSVKGWPDHKSAIQAWREEIKLVMTCEMLRFEYLLIHVPLESPTWTSLETVTRKLDTGWHPSDEKILSDTNTTYRDAAKKLEAADRQRNPAALEGPFKDAIHDPEHKTAFGTFTKTTDILDKEFGALRIKRLQP